MYEFPNSPVVFSLAAFILLVLWTRSHIWSRTLASQWKIPAFAIRSVVGFLTLLAAAELAEHIVVFSTNWRLWPILLLASILIEGVMALARLERNIVSQRAGRTLTVLRISTLLAVILVLCQPIFVFNVVHHLHRHIVILLDVSASMQIPDNNLNAAEKLRLSESLHLPTTPRPCQIEKLSERLGAAGQELLAQADWLNALSASTPVLRTRQLNQHASTQRKTLKHTHDTLEETTKTLIETSTAPFLKKTDTTTLAANLKRFTDQLTAEATQPLELAIKQMDEWKSSTNNNDTTYESVRETLRKTADYLAEAGGKLGLIGDDVDEAFYRSLSDADRKAIDHVATLRRSEVEYDLLTKRAPILSSKTKLSTSPSLLKRLEDEYGVHLYTFGTFPTEIKTSAMLGSTNPASIIAPPLPQLQITDIASALEKVSTALTPEQTAGVILFSDGRHNAARSIDPIARKFGVQGIPVFPIILGGSRVPPTDAAIAAVTAPESVSTNQKVSFKVDLKLDGLSGSNVTVTLFDGTTPVASNNIVATEASFRKQLLLSDTPKTNGMHAYRVQTEAFTNEVDASNNVFNIPVLVASDAVNVLLIEGHPRWEFRYLKNLFMQRDKNVRLEYLLFHPDQIEGVTNRPPRPASVTADPTEAEATLLPANEAEWMKFDVIILGDVAPDELGRANMESLRKYVLNRGGSLIVVAGSLHMPQAYTGTPLAEILPFTFRPTTRPLLAAPEQEFRLSLTAEGRNAIFMRLDDDPAGNQKAWNDVPLLHWRNGSLTAKKGSTVLAYATLPQLESDGQPDRIPDAETLLKQQQYELENALIVSHQSGLGSVLMFGFDQTWRLRYKKGDQYYHKLWGQILNWATADRIATGSATMRIGTPHSRYPAGSPVRITARLATPDFSPIIKATPTAILWAGDKKLSRFRLSYREGSPGLYVAEIRALPEGRYRLELENSGIRQLESAPSVSAEFSVSAAADTEKVELSADRGFLTSLAGLTAGKVLEPAALDSITKLLGPAKITSTERRQIDLWNSWPWFLLIVLLLTAEWLLRKKVRLP